MHVAPLIIMQQVSMEISDGQRPAWDHGAPSDTTSLLRSVHLAVRQCVLALPQRRYFARRS